MRRVTLLLVGITLAVYGFGLIAGAEPLLPYRLRDGLLVALAGGLIFAVNAGPLPGLGPLRPARGWAGAGRLLVATAVVCALAAAGVLTLGGDRGPAAWLGGSLWGVALLLWVTGVLWPAEGYGPPVYRWSLDAAGRFVRLALSGATADAEPMPTVGRQRLGWAMVGVLAAGWALRLWRLDQWPPTCLDLECGQALALADGSWWSGLNSASLALPTLLAAALYRLGLSGETVAALRWASALLGCAALPIFAWAARAYSRPPGVLLATALLAFSPWAVWASRLGGEWSAVPLLLAVALGAASRAGMHPDPRDWALAGAALGLLLAQPLPLAGATLLLALLAAAVTGWAVRRRARSAAGQSMALTLGSMVIVAAPLALPAASAAWIAWPASGELMAGLAALLHGGAAALPSLLEHPLLPPLSMALAAVGLAALVHTATQPRGLLVWGGLAIYLVLGVPGEVQPALALLAWLPFLALAAAVALDQTVTAFDQAWARLIRPPRAALALLILLAACWLPTALTLTRDLRSAAGAGQNAAATAMARYLAACLAGQPSGDPCTGQGADAPVFYAPPGVVDSPATRLLLGPALAEGRVRPFDPARDLLPFTAPSGDLIYLLPLDNQPLIDLFQQVYPNAPVHAEPRDEAGPALFLVYSVAQADVLAHQGLAGRILPGRDDAAAAVATRQDGPLSFGWQDEPPTTAPFRADWEGSLLLPVAGAYHFRVEGVLPNAGDPLVSLQLDGRIVLDTSLGLVEQRETLAQGYAHLRLQYTTDGPPADWAILWQPPGGALTPIPRPALYSPPLPTIGLLGTYYAGTQAQGTALTVRKDAVLGAALDLPTPYSVRWQGKLAAPRAGEYLLAVTADGPVSLQVDGVPLLDHLPPAQAGEGAGFSQASLYLDVGWHALDLRYTPTATGPDLRLLWQPPGSSPMLLLGRYLLPVTGEVTPGDVPLPPAPELVDARLGSGLFALSTSMEMVQPVRALPPQDLPALLAEPVWQMGGACGPEPFDRPHGLALDAAAARLYVADTANRRVVELDLAGGARVRTFTGDLLQEPVDVELGTDGTLLVLDAAAPAVVAVDRATGELAPLALETGFYHPRGLAVDPSGNIAIADTGGARVVLLDPRGAVLAQFGGPQSRLGTGQPVDTLAAGGTLWTITAEDGRLWRLDVLGSLAVIERANTLDGPHLAALPDGSFFLSDPSRRAVVYLAATGQPLRQLAYPDAFTAPTGVAAGVVDGETLLAVSDTAACRVSLWRVRVD